MPKSKRKKQQILSETRKKTRDVKAKTIDNIRECLSKYTYIWRVKPEDMRNSYLQQIRADWRDKGRIFFTKNRLIIRALGSNEQDEQALNLSKFSQELVGNGGILFTDEPVDNVSSYFSKTQFEDYARAGAFVDKDIIIPAGKIKYHNTGEYVVNTQKPLLEKLGMPVRVEKDSVILDQDYTICKYGDQLTVEQAHMLKQLMFKLAIFRLNPTHYYDKTTNQVIEV
ncbi:ribosomal protein L10-domain-containing protein [Glomus cerebriforme]|uniref:Ribosomal protein L10-domain-containing protein n=1 Tax=Glomus cerebriforme TaxID=658196 RepID=A0A397SZ66_9GLOM|nr:ribosomal protein L10-domain-containing protein [Glomus cerebriforme]